MDKYVRNVIRGSFSSLVVMFMVIEGLCLGSAEEGAANLLMDSSFEDPALGWEQPGWVPKSADSTWQIDTTTAFHGSNSLKVSQPSAGQLVTYSDALPVSGGEMYTFSIHLKSDTPDLPVDLYIVNSGCTNFQVKTVKVTASWERYSVSHRVPRTEKDMYARFDLKGAGTLWADAAQFETGGVATGYIEPKAVELQPQQQGVNLLPVSNNSFEQGYGGPEGWSKYGGEGGAGWALDESVFYKGTKSLKVDCPAGSKTIFILTNQPLSTGAGNTYTYSLYLKSDKSDLAADIYILEPSYKKWYMKTVNVDTEWKRYSITATLSSLFENGVSLRFDNKGEGTLWVDAIQFEEGREATAYIGQ